jgi:hypothetical protein
LFPAGAEVRWSGRFGRDGAFLAAPFALVHFTEVPHDSPLRPLWPAPHDSETRVGQPHPEQHLQPHLEHHHALINFLHYFFTSIVTAAELLFKQPLASEPAGDE